VNPVRSNQVAHQAQGGYLFEQVIGQPGRGIYSRAAIRQPNDRHTGCKGHTVEPDGGPSTPHTSGATILGTSNGLYPILVLLVHEPHHWIGETCFLVALLCQECKSSLDVC